MKKTFLACALLLAFCCHAAEKPLLGLVMIVKNEAYSMEETIKSVKPYIDRYTILDTGSTDGTQEIAKRALAGIPGEIVEEPFVNFAVSRNRVLDLAGEKSTFVLTLNGDETVKNGDALRRFCQSVKNRSEGSYMVERTDPSHFSYYCRRLIRTSKAPRFVGSTHEYLNDGSSVQVPDVSIFHDPPAVENGIKQQYRWREDLKLLTADYEEDPTNMRTLFYLAQTYDCLGEYAPAVKFYKKRAALPGWEEENFIALMRLGEVYQKWKTEEGDSQWPMALHYYLEAFAFRPTRAEPLVKIAQHYVNEGQHQLAYLFLKRAMDIPIPNDVLFVEKILYEYVRHDLMGRTAWYVGAYEEGAEVLNKLIEAYPDVPHLRTNLQYYLQAK